MAVFRFTLGIPGFEDRFIPRVVGAAGAALLVVNHVLGAQPAPAAQVGRKPVTCCTTLHSTGPSDDTCCAQPHALHPSDCYRCVRSL